MSVDNLRTFFKDLNVVIEFGLEEATIRYLKEANKFNVAYISGSTGLSSNTLKLMKKCSKKFQFYGLPT